MRSRTPLPARGQGQVRPFLEAAVLFAALCIFARSAALGLAAAITAPLPMAETLLWLGRQAAGETASSVQEQAEPESAPQGPASSLPQAVQALPGSIEDYLVPLLGRMPVRQTQGRSLKSNIRRAAAKSTSPAGRAASRTTPGRAQRTLRQRSRIRCPLPSSRTAPTRRCW